MSYDNPATHGLFEELLAGATAVKERPTLIAERDKALSEVEFHKSRLNSSQTQLDAVRQVMSDQDAKIAKLEADLAAATFREQEVRNKLETLVTSFQTVIGDIKSATELANELVAPAPEPVPASAPSTTDNVYGSGDYMGDSNIHPFQATTDQGGSSNATLDTTQVQFDQGDQGSAIPGHFVSGSGFTPDYSQGVPLPNPSPSTPRSEDTGSGLGSTETSEVSRDTGPFAGSPEAQSPSAPTTSATLDTPAPNLESALGSKEYWRKPTPTTWRDWIAQGGDKAPWVTANDLDHAY